MGGWPLSLRGGQATINWRGIPYYIGKSIFGSQRWRECLDEVEHSEADELSERYLRQLLRHAHDKVPYYRSLGLPDRPLSEYPLLTKEQLRRNPDSLMRTDLSDHRWRTITTSGSTGGPLEIVGDLDEKAWFEATETWYLKQLLGTPRWRVLSESKVRIWHRRKNDRTWKRRAQLFAPRRWLDPGSTLSEQSLLDYARVIRRARPSFIWAYPGVLFEIARTATSQNVRMHRPRFIISSGETLHAFMRPVIQEAFGCPVYDLYGSAEAGLVAGECRAGNLHVFSFASKVELLDPVGRPVSPGEEGRLVLTPLHNYAMPLIRFDTADMAQVGHSDCPCGCQLPTLRRITGRTNEFLVTSSGSLISGATFYLLLKRCRWIQSYQVLQRDINQMTVFFNRIAGSDVLAEDIEMVNEEFASLMGDECAVDWREVEEIPRTPNGKRPYTRSLVWEASLPAGIWEAT